MLPTWLDPRRYVADLPAPRRETRNQLHPLQERLMRVRCAVLSGVADWVGMAAVAHEQEAWWQGFLDLPTGIASHDPLSAVLGRIDPVAFKTAFTAWATAALPGLADEPVCVAGKAGRGSREGATGAVHRVSAVASRARWVRAQQAVAAQSTESTAIPALLRLLDLHGAVVSSDAMGCQKAIAQTIMEAGAEYGLALTANHPTVCDDVHRWWETEVARGRWLVQETVEKDQGRIEIRRDVLSDRIDWLAAKPDWAGLQAIGRVESTRRIGDQTRTEGRSFLCAFPQRDRVAAPVRGHWGSEPQQHGVLAVPFGEDAGRTRKDHSAENRALRRRMALNRLRRNGPPRDRIRRRQRRAALNEDYRSRLLWGVPTPATT